MWMGWCFEVWALSAFLMPGTGHRELALRFPNAHHFQGAASSQLSTWIWARRKEYQSDFLCHPGLLAPSLLSSCWMSREANSFHCQHQQNHTRAQVCSSFPVPLPKPLIDSKVKKKGPLKYLLVWNIRIGHTSNWNILEVRTKCHPSTKVWSFCLSWGVGTCLKEKLPPLTGQSQWPLTITPVGPSCPLHTAARTSLCSSNLSLSLLCFKTFVQRASRLQNRAQVPCHDRQGLSSSSQTCHLPPAHLPFCPARLLGIQYLLEWIN